MHKKGQAGIMALVMAIIMIVAVAIPITMEVTTAANLTGVTKTVIDLLPLLLGVGALTLVGSTIRTN